MIAPCDGVSCAAAGDTDSSVSTSAPQARCALCRKRTLELLFDVPGLELRSPVPAARLKALRRLNEGGVRAGVLLAPILPGITDDREGLSRLMAQAKEAGARYVVGSALRLGPAARLVFTDALIVGRC